MFNTDDARKDGSLGTVHEKYSIMNINFDIKLPMFKAQ